MGILTLLRNALGRSRKGRTAEAEGVEQTPSQATEQTSSQVPEQASPQVTEAKVPSPATEPTAEPAPEPTPRPTATTPPAQVPEPRTSTLSTKEEHDLVAAAFDKVTVPNQMPLGEQREPVTEERAAAVTPVDSEPVAEEPAAEKPVVEEPAAEAAPASSEAVVSEPVVEEPTASEPVTPEPEKPVAEAAPVASEPVVEEPVVEEPVVEEPAKPEPEPAKPTEEEPTAEEPAQATAADDQPESEPVTAAETTPEPEPKSEPEPVAEAAPEPEPDPEPATEATPEPAAAAADGEGEGEDTPQGPPAADDEGSTGGAGGNIPSEGDAEDTDAAQPPQATREDEDAITVPATLRTAYDAAATALTAKNLTGTTAKTYLVLDRSASMRPYYKDGSAQALAEQTLALAAHLDPEAPAAKVHVVFFSTEVDGTGELTLTDHENKIDELHAGLGRMGRTSYHAAVEAVVTHHDKHAAGTPALVVFQTDGAPDAKTPATQSLTEAAKAHPSVFFSFVAFGEHDNKAFDYLRKLKTDNTSFFHAGPTPRELTDTELYEGVLASWRP
ncbi:VWA domain-containing protein [Streptomyces cellulosae]|uniref:VWA domain-containing protein n=1 Tax=Streptomyces cellulosae TaxID=1968 RepID=UPI0004CC5AF8|nr:VWA domain-containing protein [Streptomyces cellulosae]